MRAVDTNHKDLTLQDAGVVLAARKIFQGRPTLGFSDGHGPAKAGHYVPSRSG